MSLYRKLVVLVLILSIVQLAICQQSSRVRAAEGRLDKAQSLYNLGLGGQQDVIRAEGQVRVAKAQDEYDRINLLFKAGSASNIDLIRAEESLALTRADARLVLCQWALASAQNGQTAGTSTGVSVRQATYALAVAQYDFLDTQLSYLQKEFDVVQALVKASKMSLADLQQEQSRVIEVTELLRRAKVRVLALRNQ